MTRGSPGVGRALPGRPCRLLRPGSVAATLRSTEAASSPRAPACTLSGERRRPGGEQLPSRKLSKKRKSPSFPREVSGVPGEVRRPSTLSWPPAPPGAR